MTQSTNMPTPAATARVPGPSLLVFSDDWGRHPSSCQHLIRELLPRYQVCWVNTIGMRPPRLDKLTFKRGMEKLRQWREGPRERVPESENPRVLNPKMWPWCTRPWDRSLNQILLTRQLDPVIAELPRPVVAVTTLPITCDLVGRLPVDGWVYYRVDDFGKWPGLDGSLLEYLDEELMYAADRLVAAGEVLARQIEARGRDCVRLTHGVHLEHWTAPKSPAEDPFAGLPRPVILFWGVVDRRMDVEFIRRLATALQQGSLVLVGPTNEPEPALFSIPHVVHRPPVAYSRLPEFAAAADVLVMPYADLPVTRAMEPLKLKEFLATGKPAVVRDLPAVTPWKDCCDVAGTAGIFAELVLQRVRSGLPEEQRVARQRLVDENWQAKARRFESVLQELCHDGGMWCHSRSSRNSWTEFENGEHVGTSCDQTNDAFLGAQI